MKVMITGAGGNIGRRLLEELQARGHDVTGLRHRDLDITNFRTVGKHIGDASPDLIIHCAAMTQVDRCAEQPDEALRINASGTQNVALACQRVGAAICYLSTNEVFDGERGEPYLEYDAPHPINPYGYSKWVGEQMVRDLLPRHYIVRTSWLFAHSGHNFLQKILQLAGQGNPLKVVCNEVASPTYAEDLVQALSALVETERFGVYHLTNEGRASRFEFARYILDCAGYATLSITPIIQAQYPRPSRPPTYSALRNFNAAQLGIQLRPWRAAVDAFIEQEKALTAAVR